MHRSILAALAALLLSFSPSHAQQPVPPGRGPIITVRGEGRSDLAPDHARLTVEVTTRGKTIEATTAAHRERAARAVAILRDMAKDGVEIERSSFRLDQIKLPLAPNAGQKTPEQEYKSVTTFALKTRRLDAVDAAITAIAASGLFEIHHLRFGIDERSKALGAARKNAVEDARERARVYADAAGVRLGDILDIRDTDSRVPREAAAEMLVARNVQVIPPESIPLNASVTITWQIRPRP